jgi:hypothetical protein
MGNARYRTTIRVTTTSWQGRLHTWMATNENGARWARRRRTLATSIPGNDGEAEQELAIDSPDPNQTLQQRALDRRGNLVLGCEGPQARPDSSIPCQRTGSDYEDLDLVFPDHRGNDVQP